MFDDLAHKRMHRRQAMGGGGPGRGDDDDDDLFGGLFGTTTTSSAPTTRGTSTTSTAVKTTSTEETSTRRVTATVQTTTTTSTSSTSSTSSSSSSSSSSTSSSSSQTSLSSSSSAIRNIAPVTTLASSTSTIHTVTVDQSASAARASASASASSVATTGAVSNVGPIIGGVAGGILGLVFLLAAISFVLRRMRKKHDPVDLDFDPNHFRRSGVQITDDSAGFAPRPPPKMSEARSRTPMSFGMMYGMPGPERPEHTQPQYTPGYANSASSANPMMAPAAYQQYEYSPQPSPIGQYSRPQSNQTLVSMSAGPAQYANYPYANDPARGSSAPSTPYTSDYVDLERSSVTPFQAAQYAEIASRIESEPPKGLDTPAVEQFMHARSVGDIPPIPVKDRSPFNDPTPSDSMPHGELDFPVPPSPQVSSRYRIPSMPPSLPDISFERNSVSSYDFPASIHAPVKKDIAPSPVSQTEEKKPRPETVYDMDDAYGGI